MRRISRDPIALRLWTPPAVAVAVVCSTLFVLSSGGALAQQTCAAPQPVCAARDSVFALSSTFDPYASAVRIGPDLLVTNRHAVADAGTVQITLVDGNKVEGTVIPSSFEADLILIRAALPQGSVSVRGREASGDLYVIGQDIGARRIRVFPKGNLLRAADPSKPLSRLHHTAYTQPGLSGGALVNAAGELVGIATSGGAGRFEAVPTARLAKLEELSGGAHVSRSVEIGRAYRDCIIDLEKAGRTRDALASDAGVRIKKSCTETGNRQLFDLAGQLFGKARDFEAALDFFRRSLDTDPNAINARIGMVITLTFAQRPRDALDHVRWLIDVVPQSTQVQRFAVHVGKSAGDMALAEKGLALIAKHNPAQLEAAKRFLEAPVRQRRRR